MEGRYADTSTWKWYEVRLPCSTNSNYAAVPFISCFVLTFTLPHQYLTLSSWEAEQCHGVIPGEPPSGSLLWFSLHVWVHSNMNLSNTELSHSSGSVSLKITVILSYEPLSHHCISLWVHGNRGYRSTLCVLLITRHHTLFLLYPTTGVKCVLSCGWPSNAINTVYVYSIHHTHTPSCVFGAFLYSYTIKGYCTFYHRHFVSWLYGLQVVTTLDLLVQANG